MTLFRFALVLIAFAGQADSAIDPSQIDGLAKRWGERWYVGSKNGKPMFAGRLKVVEATHEKEPCFSFEGEARMGMDGTFYGARAAFLCRKDRYLTPLKFSCDVIDDKKNTVSFLSLFTDGKVTTRWGTNFEQNRVKDIPADLVHTLAVIPLMTAAAFRKDATTNITYYDLFDNYGSIERKECRIAYDGVEDVGNRKAHRILLKYRSMTQTYWVSEERELLQFALGDSDFGRMTLTDEKTGKSALEELKPKPK